LIKCIIFKGVTDVKKYIIYPGYIESINDKETHYIDAQKLMALYNVKENECHIIYDETDTRNKYNSQCLSESNLIQLFPLRNGNYKDCLKKLLEENPHTCNNCYFCANKQDPKIYCTLHNEEYKDDKQVLFCSAQNNIHTF